MADWDKQYKDGQGRFWPAEELVRFLGRVYGTMAQMRAANLTAIDLGCGVGGNAWALAGYGFMVVGLEVSPVAIGIAEDWAAKKGFRPYFTTQVYKAPDSIKWPAGSVSLVIDIQTIQHLNKDHHAAMYGEIKRVLVPNGKFFSVHWSGGEMCEKIFPAHPELKQWGKDSVSQIPDMLKAAGFTVPYVEVVTKTYDRGKALAAWTVIEAIKP